MLDEFFRRHDKIFRWVRPRAGSVCYPEYLGGDIDDFAARLVEREGVLLLPASQFGDPGTIVSATAGIISASATADATCRTRSRVSRSMFSATHRTD